MEKKLIGTHTVLYIGGGDSGWLTQSYATCHRTFHKEVILADATKESEWTEWTDKQKAEWEKNPPAPAERNEFTVEAERAGAKLNDRTGYYELNGLTDLTESYVRECYNNIPRRTSGQFADYDLSAFGPESWKARLRTNFPFSQFFRRCQNLSIYGQELLEVLNLDSIYSSNKQPFTVFGNIDTFYNRDLRKIIGVIDVSNSSANHTNSYSNSMTKLEEVCFKGVHTNFYFLRYSPLINFESMDYLIRNSTNNTKAINIGVHPTTYSYLTGEAEPSGQVGGTAEQWQALLALAEEKNVTIVTTE